MTLNIQEKAVLTVVPTGVRTKSLIALIILLDGHILSGQPMVN
jgi:hypothetical protein